MCKVTTAVAQSGRPICVRSVYCAECIVSQSAARVPSLAKQQMCIHGKHNIDSREHHYNIPSFLYTLQHTNTEERSMQPLAIAVNVVDLRPSLVPPADHRALRRWREASYVAALQNHAVRVCPGKPVLLKSHLRGQADMKSIPRTALRSPR